VGAHQTNLEDRFEVFAERVALDLALALAFVIGNKPAYVLYI
jgi:hypothetical protein